MLVVAFSLVALIGFAAIAIDLSHARHVDQEVQVATDAAALAGTTQLDMYGGGLPLSRVEAVRIAAANVANNTPVDDVNMNLSNAPNGDVVIGRWNFLHRTWDPAPRTWKANGVLVRARRAGPTAVQTWFGQVLGFQQVDLRAESTAARGGPRCISSYPLFVKDCAIEDALGNLDCSGRLREFAPMAYGNGGVTDLGDINASPNSLRQIINNYSRTGACNANGGDTIRLYDELQQLMPDIDRILDPDGDGVPTPVTVEIPVIEAPRSCQIQNFGSYRISGFADIELLSVTPPNRWVRFRVLCGRNVTERSGSNFFGIRAEPVLVR